MNPVLDIAQSVSIDTATQARSIDHDSPRQRASGTRPARNAHQQIADELTRRLGPDRYRMWFGQTTLTIDGSRLEAQTASPFVARWIEGNYAEMLRIVAGQALGRAMEIIISVAPAVPNDDSRLTTDESHATPSRTRQSSIDNRESTAAARGPRLHALEEFVVSATNRMAHAAACRLADGAEPRGLSPLFIHGECGVGKTHLLQGVCRRYIERTGKATRVRYVTGEQFTNEYIAAIRSGAIETFRQRVRKLELLAIDDVHFLANKIKTQSEFQCTLDAIDFGGARVVLASDNHPHHIRRFSQSLVSRFVAGMVVKVERPDRALRCALITRMAERRGVTITQAAAEELASSTAGSARELEGAMTRLAAYRTLMNGDSAHPHDQQHEIGMLLVQQVLREERTRPSHLVRIVNIIEVTCTRLAVNRSDLISTSRHRRIVIARAMVAYLSRELTTMSYPEIAQALGRENHSTVHTADQRLRRQLAADEPLKVGGHEPAASLRELADLLRRDICRGVE